MECFLNAHNRFCAEHRFCEAPADLPLTCVLGCDMIFVLGRIFPARFLCPGRPAGGSVPHRPCQRNNPRSSDRGLFLFGLGFNHWVTSLSLDQPGSVFVGIFRCIPVFSACIAIDIYGKRKIKAQPAGVGTICGITFFVMKE